MSGELGTLGDDERCRRCDGENVVWSAPSPLWNLVMRGNDIDGEPRWSDLVCIRCFIVLAKEAGVRGRWRVSVDPEPEGLIKVTPSGRVWDADRWLWVEARTFPRSAVAIDPDGSDVNRLVIRLGTRYKGSTREMRETLRDLHTDPKPDEPHGLGAVVEDAYGRRWIRTYHSVGYQWQYLSERRDYDTVIAVHVLSEGVAP